MAIPAAQHTRCTDDDVSPAWGIHATRSITRRRTGMPFFRRRSNSSRFTGIKREFTRRADPYATVCRFSGVRDPRDAQHYAPENRQAVSPAPVKWQPFHQRVVRLCVARIPLHTGSLYYSFAGWLSLYRCVCWFACLPLERRNSSSNGNVTEYKHLTSTPHSRVAQHLHAYSIISPSLHLCQLLSCIMILSVGLVCRMLCRNISYWCLKKSFI